MAKARRMKRGKGGRFVAKSRRPKKRRSARSYTSSRGMQTTRRAASPRRRSNPKSIMTTPAVQLGWFFLLGAGVSTYAGRQEWVTRYSPGGINPTLMIAIGLGAIATFMLKGKNRQRAIAFAIGLAAPWAIQMGAEWTAKLGNNGSGGDIESTVSKMTRGNRPYIPGRSASPMASAMTGGRDYETRAA